jgi:acetate kinase
MNSLVLIPSKNGVRYSTHFLEAPTSRKISATKAGKFHGVSTSVKELKTDLNRQTESCPIDLVTIRTIFGGTEFPTAVMWTTENEERFRKIAYQAPLSLGQTRRLMDQALSEFPQTPMALAFETSFFVNLPSRETTYALPTDTGIQVRRWGYHGLFHDAATQAFAWKWQGRSIRPRILSICLEPQPEMAAVLGHTPLLVTGGSTPVEGLPGECNSGEIDPAIPLALAADPAIGPEKANILLTQESGYSGLLGRPASLHEVLMGKTIRLTQIREHLLYRMCLAAGSSLAALEGLDGVVFSGRYTDCAKIVAAKLLPRLEQTLDLAPGSLPWSTCSLPIETIVAEAGFSARIADNSNFPSSECSGGRGFPRSDYADRR